MRCEELPGEPEDDGQFGGQSSERVCKGGRVGGQRLKIKVKASRWDTCEGLMRTAGTAVAEQCKGFKEGPSGEEVSLCHHNGDEPFQRPICHPDPASGAGAYGHIFTPSH